MPKARGQPFSIRLSERTGRLVEEEARRSRRSRGAVVEELTEEAAKTRLFPGIAFRGPAPRRAWVIGTGLDVWEIVAMHEDYDGDLKRILENHKSLTERTVRLALAYAERFPEEIAEPLALLRRPEADLRDLYPFLSFETNVR